MLRSSGTNVDALGRLATAWVGAGSKLAHAGVARTSGLRSQSWRAAACIADKCRCRGCGQCAHRSLPSAWQQLLGETTLSVRQSFGEGSVLRDSSGEIGRMGVQQPGSCLDAYPQAGSWEAQGVLRPSV